MDRFIELIEESDIQGINKELSSKNSISELVDSNGNTLIHACAMCSQLEILKILIAHVILIQELNFSGLEGTEYFINKKNQKGLSPFLMSVIYGQLVTIIQEILEELGKNGADIFTKSNDGKNAVHLAAENDKPHIIAHLSDLNVPLSVRNSNGDTPLHLAVDMNAYKSLSLLLALKVSRSKKNSDGHTPLHIAAKNNNGRMVRLLLLKGFNKDEKDKQGKLPYELATDKDIKSLFKSAGIKEIFGYKPMVADGKKKNYLPFIIFCGILIITFFLDAIYLEPCKIYIDNKTFSYIFDSAVIVELFLIIFLLNSNPGYIAKGDPKDLTVRFIQKLYNDGREVCPECFIIKKKRSRHCYYCGKCVEKYDHHCQWVNNCIGGK